MSNYNLTAYDAARNIFEMIPATVTLTGDILGAVAIFGIAIITFFALQRRTSFLNAMPSSGFITTIMAIGMWAINVIDMSILLWPVLYFFLGVFLRVLFWDD